MEEFERIFDVLETVEVVVDEILQFDIQMRNLHVELDVITVEFVVLVIQQLMSLLLEIIDDLFEMFG